MKPINVEGYRLAARRKLPKAIFDFVDGGAEDEVTLRANRDAFSALRLRYRIHEDDRPVELSTSLCNQPMSMPVMLSPVGNVGMVHSAGDLGVARVAAKLGLLMLMSGGASYTIEEVAAGVDTKPWYQLYPWGGRDFYGDIMDRAAAAGFRGLIVTIDTPGGSNRERDIANGFAIPPRLTRRNAWDLVRHPRWTAGVIRDRRVVVRVFREDERRPPLHTFIGEATRTAAQVTRRLTRPKWDDLAWMRARWKGPFGIKGIVDPGDARRAVELGAEVIYVSNHGGRQLDSAPAALEALPAIVEVVGGRAEVVLDGGVRRGTDIIKALCLGARCISIGRPWVYGLAAAGPPGVERVLEAFRREISIALVLLGQTNIHQLDSSYLMRAGLDTSGQSERALPTNRRLSRRA
jgi:isopentenyl diphosphate isomerase/L-lactate dehydrogenase-like FMN-dependent dehydrogenase